MRTATPKELNAKVALSGMASFIQNQKIKISIEGIRKSQTEGRFPEDYFSYVTSVTAKNRSSKPEQFFRWQSNSPQYWNKKFFFFPKIEGSIKAKGGV